MADAILAVGPPELSPAWQTVSGGVLVFVFTKVSKLGHVKLGSNISARAQKEKQPGVQRHSSTEAHKHPAALKTKSLLQTCLKAGIVTFC